LNPNNAFEPRIKRIYTDKGMLEKSGHAGLALFLHVPSVPIRGIRGEISLFSGVRSSRVECWTDLASAPRMTTIFEDSSLPWGLVGI